MQTFSWIAGVLLLACVAVSPALAAPKSVSVSYNLLRNGTHIAVINERFEIKDGSYRITSDSKALGIYALAQRLSLHYSSTGKITKDGLRPHQFDGQRGKDTGSTEFDWKSEKLVMTYNGRAETVTLPPGTQDRVSAMYQFMYSAPAKPRTFEFAMTTGRKLDHYRYAVNQDVVVDTPLKQLTTMHLVKQREKDDTGTEIWLSPEFHYLPVKVLITENDGVRYEQVVTRLEITP